MPGVLLSNKGNLFMDTIESGQYIKELIPMYVGVNKPKPRTSGPKDLLPLLTSLVKNPAQEHFIAVYLNTQSDVITYALLHIGLLDQVGSHPREIFRPAIACGATQIVIAHNHPEGPCRPSRTDETFTRTVYQASRIIGIPLVDHLIFNMDGEICSLAARYPDLFSNDLGRMPRGLRKAMEGLEYLLDKEV